MSCSEPLGPTILKDTPLTKLKEALLRAPRLTLPNPTIPFSVYTTADKDHAMGVLEHSKGPSLQAVTYLSKQLDTIVRGILPCLWALAVAAILTPEAKMFIL